LSSISARAIFHEHIVERLVGAMWKAVDVHIPDPFMPHHAGGIPAINHAVIAISNKKNCTSNTMKTPEPALFPQD